MKTRRDFIKISGMGIAAASTPIRTYASKPAIATPFDKKIPFELGIASYTFRKFSLEDTLTMTNRLGIKNIAFKSFHLELGSTPEQIAEVVKKVKDAGLNLYGGGVIYMKTEEEVNQAFEYAKLAGMKIIIGAPNHELLPLVDKKVKQYNISVAIHNHGPGDKLYPTLESIYEKIKNLDPGIGMCHDIGHTSRYGEDPVKNTERFFDRVLDVHLKDESEASAEGNTCEMGRGIIDIPGVLRVLVERNYTGKASFEFEKDENDPLPGLAESVGYTRGILRML